MTTGALDFLPLWGFFALAVASALLSLELGFRTARWRHQHADAEKDAPIGTLVGAILGLLAFMLAFTFNMAASRFDARRMTVLEEANSIGTTYLRTRLLPDPERSASANLLRQYVDARLQAIGDTARFDDALKRSESIQHELWAQATAAAAKAPDSVMIGIYIQSLNETIDVHSKRLLIGARSRIPASIWIGLFALALIGMTSMGYQAGLAATRRSPAVLFLAVAFAGVLLLIADLDRAHEGMLQVGQQSMLDLQRSMQSPKL
ncbi:MAG: hypothetical protein AB7F89_26375 [Pirellulaceae bacterium]